MSFEEAHDFAETLCFISDVGSLLDCGGFPLLSAVRIIHSLTGASQTARAKAIDRSPDSWNYCGIPGGCRCSLTKVCAKDHCSCDRLRVCVRDQCNCRRTKACANLNCSCSRPKVVIETSKRFTYTMCAVKGGCDCNLYKVCTDRSCRCDRPKVVDSACWNTRCHCGRPKVYRG